MKDHVGGQKEYGVEGVKMMMMMKKRDSNKRRLTLLSHVGVTNEKGWIQLM